MGDLADKLMEELACRTSFTIPVFGGIPVPESCVMTWFIMGLLVIGSIIFTKRMKVVPTGFQCLVESFVLWMDNFFLEILGSKGKKYLPILETLLLYIGISNLIGLVGNRLSKISFY